ncbi:MAG: putative bifunctional diguanylate cyclase/phosphodiesterase [Acidobacteriota bacterium]
MNWSIFDNRTLLIVSVYLLILFTLSLLVNYRQYRSYPGQKAWIIASMIMTCAFLLLTGQGLLPPVISVSIAILLITLAIGLMGVGVNWIVGRPSGWHLYTALGLITLGLIFYFSQIDLNPAARICTISLYMSLVSLHVAFNIVRAAEKRLRLPYWSAATLLTLVSASFVVRAITIFYSPQTVYIIDPGKYNTIGMLVILFAVTGWFVCMAILFSARLGYEIEQSSEDDLKLIIEASNEGHWSIDYVNDKRYYSDKWYTVLGHQIMLDDFEQWRGIVHEDDYDNVVKAISDHLKRKTPFFSIEYRVKDHDDGWRWVLAKGKVIFDDKGNLIKAAGSHLDITEQKAQEEKVNFLAFHDALTSMPNRFYLRRELDDKLKGGTSLRNQGAFIFIDLDNFKLINDSYGHSYGDKLLMQIAGRLLTLHDERSIIARLGGDEFTVFVKDPGDVLEIEDYISGILSLFEGPFTVDGMMFNITTSIGVALYPEHGSDFDTLLRNADAAMYRAKEAGRNQFMIYDSSMTRHVEEKVRLDWMLRKAVNNNEFVLSYQPLVDVIDQKVCGFEALVRWNSGDESIEPSEFIKHSEENGLIVQLGAWIIENACIFGNQLIKTGQEDFIISVNISAVQVMQESFVNLVMDVLKRTGFPPHYLQVEITETALIKSFEANLLKLQRLSSLGIRIALDDFGTGYSSLSYLKRLPINAIKIDRSFLDDINEASEGGILEAIINIAHRLDIKVVAEGVETKEQFQHLYMLGCDVVQGYLFDRALSTDEVLEMAWKRKL